jgi:hypothetical protein
MTRQSPRGGHGQAATGWILVIGDGSLQELAGPGKGGRSLGRFLGRATERSLSSRRQEDVAGWAVTGHHSATAAWAPGPVTWRADFGEEAPLGAVRADPIHLSPGPSGVTVDVAANLGISQAEAQRMCEAVADALGDRVIGCRPAAPDRWYLTMTAVPDGPWWTPEELVDRDLLASIPDGEEGTDLKVLLNDIQVVLHQQEDNARRRAQGLPEVNSVWLWGWTQRTLMRVGSQVSRVYSSHPYATGLAQLAGVTVHAVEELPRTVSGDGVVVAIGGGDRNDPAARWCEQLVRAFARRRIDRLRVVTLSGRVFERQRRGWRLPWRRRSSG